MTGKAEKTLILSVAYPGVEGYLSDYSASLQDQTHQDFDLLILNDGVSTEIRGNLPPQAKVIEVEQGKTPAEIRFQGLSFALDNHYDYLIFSDTDDYFSENRVGDSIAGLKEYDFVYNRLRTVTDGGGEGREVLGAYPPGCAGYESILERNLFGLSNTAVTVKVLEGIYIPGELIAVDWWIFTILLLRGCRGGYVKDAVTYYRQSDDNTVGMGRLLTEERLKLEIEAKRLHYRNLSAYCERNGLNKEGAVFRKKLSEMEELKARVENAEFRERYLGTINKNFKEIFTGWWSEILSIGEWENYA